MLKPLAGYVLIEPAPKETKTASGIVLPESAEEKPQEGRVMAVGDSKEIKVKKNQKIIFNRYGGTEVKINNEEYLIVKNEDVLAIVE